MVSAMSKATFPTFSATNAFPVALVIPVNRAANDLQLQQNHGE